MGAPKYKQKTARPKHMQQQTEINKRNKSQSVEDKQKIDSLKKIISSKIKAPDLAKKAAQIISEMLNNSKK